MMVGGQRSQRSVLGPREERENPGGFSFPLPKSGGFWWLVEPHGHLLQKEKSKDFRNHVTKYLETLLNSQQQVSGPRCGFTSKFRPSLGISQA